jgi:phage shock protein PspC (stress-responsive transcriptional regulator)
MKNKTAFWFIIKATSLFAVYTIAKFILPNEQVTLDNFGYHV